VALVKYSKRRIQISFFHIAGLSLGKQLKNTSLNLLPPFPLRGGHTFVLDCRMYQLYYVVPVPCIFTVSKIYRRLRGLVGVLALTTPRSWSMNGYLKAGWSAKKYQLLIAFSPPNLD